MCYLSENNAQQKNSLKKFNNTIANISINLGASSKNHKSYLNDVTGTIDEYTPKKNGAATTTSKNANINNKNKNLNLSWNNSGNSNNNNFDGTINTLKTLGGANKEEHRKSPKKNQTNEMNFATGSNKKNSFLNKTLNPDVNSTTVDTFQLNSRRNSNKISGKISSSNILNPSLIQSTTRLRW